jgi:hypothetical protein
MDDHHSPVKAGTVGTVVSVERIPWGDLGYQYRMIWDNKSTLSLDPELDSWVFKKDWDEKIKTKKVDESFEIYEEVFRQLNNKSI